VETHSLKVQRTVDRLLELGTCRQAQISLRCCNRRVYRDWESASVANLPQYPAWVAEGVSRSYRTARGAARGEFQMTAGGVGR
jgi:hypothetical protein